jgi:hypothetical protein
MLTSNNVFCFLLIFMYQVTLGTKVGRAKHMRIMPGGALESDATQELGPSSMFVGRKLDEHRGAFVLEYPMDKGVVIDSGWDAMECLWEVRYHYLHYIHRNLGSVRRYSF